MTRLNIIFTSIYYYFLLLHMSSKHRNILIDHNTTIFSLISTFVKCNNIINFSTLL